MNPSFVRVALAIPFLLSSAAVASAANQTVTLTDTARGWYNSFGGHTASNESYSAGQLTPNLFRNFFVFDLASLPPTIESATLRLEVPGSGYVSGDATEDYELHEVTTDPATLDVDATGLTAVYDDLGDGPAYGSRTYSAADSGTVTEIVLNGAAIAALNAGVGDLFAFGGTISSVVGMTGQLVFANTHAAPFLVELEVEYRVDDSFKCYKAKDLKFPAAFAKLEGVNLVDDYVTDPAASVTKLASVCMPVERDGRVAFDPTTARCCYKVKTLAAPTVATATIDDEFGTLGVSFQKAQTICVPCTVTPTP